MATESVRFGQPVYLNTAGLVPLDVLPTGVLTAFQQTTAPCTPSATAGTYGTPQTLSAGTGYGGFMVIGGSDTSSGVATESVTLQAQITYSDGTTATNALVTITTNATASFSLTQIETMLGQVNGKQVQSLAFSVKSTINSSTAAVTVTIIGLNLP